MAFVPEGQYDLSQAQKCLESVPKEPSRRVRYDRSLLIPGDSGGTATPISVLQGRHLKRGHRPPCETISINTNTAITELMRALLQESDRTLRDGSFGTAIPRHFVPGYDRSVPPGQKPFAHGKPH
jgi:hypothetical protein